MTCVDWQPREQNNPEEGHNLVLIESTITPILQHAHVLPLKPL